MLKGPRAFGLTPGRAFDFSSISVDAPIQAKLTVNAPGDAYEQEADQVASTVMRKPDAHAPGACACGGTCSKCSHGSGTPAAVQTKRFSPAGAAAALAPEAVTGVLRSPGKPLTTATRRNMESRFGHDFSTVRIHDDARASASAQALRAQAYTTGDDVVFGAGQYAPATGAGQHLLAHELTHVIQQRGIRSPQTIQRSIALTDPGGTPPHPAGALGPWPSKALTLQGWLQTLCPDGKWEVDAASGAVDSKSKPTFCGAAPAQGKIHHTTSADPVSCGCLCELTGAGSKTIEVQIDENLKVGAASFPLIPLGEAATSHVSPTSKVSAFTGRDFVGISGAGATNPLAGAGRGQTLPDPPWIIFGHEVCGHGRKQSGPMVPTKVEHSTTPKGDVTAVDVENQIRREHSTATSSLGIRGATFSAKDAGGNFASHNGAVFSAGAGDTIPIVAARCGIPAASMLDHIWRSNGDKITAATQNTLAAGEQLLIEGIDWHQVIKDETLATIATMWGIPLASLKRANPNIAAPFAINPGDRLLIPAS
jgi:hypothetical protein